MNKKSLEINNKYRFLMYSTFLFLVYLELIVFLQNILFYESIYFNIYYLIFVVLLLYTLKLEVYALNTGSVRQLVFVTILIAINPVITIFEVFDINYMDIPIFINVCVIIYKVLRREID